MSSRIAFTCNGCGVSDEGRLQPFDAEELPGATPVGTLFVRPPRAWYIVTCLIAPEDEVRFERDGAAAPPASGAMVLAICPSCAEKRRFYGATQPASA